MRHFPIYLDMSRAQVVLVGGGEAALAKLRLLTKTPARITVHAEAPLPDLLRMAHQGLVVLSRAPLTREALEGATLVYAAQEESAHDHVVARLAAEAGVLCNIVDDLAGSDFITPAIVDRAPLTVAIGTEGAAPMLARSVKRDLEERLPAATADLATAASRFRPQAEALPHGRARRDFWAEWFAQAGPAAVAKDEDPEAALQALLNRHLEAGHRPGHITLTFTGNDDPDLMTLKARKALDAADVVFHDSGIAKPVLELARREARFVSLEAPRVVPPLHRLLADAASAGQHVIYIAAHPLPAALIEKIGRSTIDMTVIPGVAELSPDWSAAPQSTRGRRTDRRKERA